MHQYLLIITLLALPPKACAALLDDALPMVGTAGTGYTYPAAVYPFGMVQLGPDTESDGRHNCSGYKYEDRKIIGFSHTHLSGTGCPDLGDILIQPTTGELRMDQGDPTRGEKGFLSSFSHDDEVATPGYYRVLLKDYGITAELTATAHTGFHRYTFPSAKQAHLILDLAHGISNDSRTNSCIESTLVMEDDQTISGYRRSSGWARDKTYFFVAKFNRPFDSHGFMTNGIDMPGSTSAKGVGVKAHFDFQSKKDEVVLLRVGISPVSIGEARKNLDAEIPKEDFQETMDATRAEWNRLLGTIRIETTDPVIRQTFTTALYHSLLAPHLYNDADGSYRGADGKVHQASFQYYSTFSVWDQFRAWHPLMTIIQPGRVSDFIRTMLAFYEQETPHFLPIWPLCSNETHCMPGYHALPIIADAYAKGLRDYDVNKVYAAMRDTALTGRENHDEYVTKGYISTVEENHDHPKATYKKSVSTTLDYAYDDWCMARMAHLTGHQGDEVSFLKRSLSYKSLFDRETGFMRGKTAGGTFIAPFDAKTFYRPDYTEADAWQSSFFVPHDPRGFIEMMGGDGAFIEKIDRMFSEDSAVINGIADITGTIGQYAHGNEPVHNYAFLFSYAGAPYKTQERVRQVMSALYDNTVHGLCGNDDCGQMSAWYVLSAIGIYPVNPADGNYVIGSPLVDKAVISLDSKYYKGGTFTIVARNNSAANKYIQSAKLNGRPLSRSYITHAEVVAGGELDLVMGPTPNKTLWQEPSARPPSLSLD